MINNKYKLLKLIFFIVLFVIIFPIIGNATNRNDLLLENVPTYFNKTGQLNIKLEDFDFSKCNINFSLYHIKEISDFEKLKYSLTKEFEKCTSINTEEYSKNTINEILEYIKINNITGKTQKVDNKGNATFKELNLGTYLIVMEKFEYDGKIYQTDSIIINIPQKDVEIDWNYIITAYPKIFEYQENNSNNLGDILQSEQSNKLPVTGQLTWPIPVFAFLGLMFLLIGFSLYFMKRDYHDE